MDPDACYRRLREHRVGRLAVIEGGSPMIFPVNYVIDEEQAIVVKTNAGSKLLWSQRSSVAFEIDEIDEKMKQGWSVVVRGRAEEVTPHDTDRYENAGMLDVQPWAEGDRSHLLRIVPNSVTGRELVPQD